MCPLPREHRHVRLAQTRDVVAIWLLERTQFVEGEALAVQVVVGARRKRSGLTRVKQNANKREGPKH